MKTKVVNLKYSEYDVFIGRPSKWGNPFYVGGLQDRSKACEKFKIWLAGKIKAPHGQVPPTKEEIIKELKGKRLGCYCAPLECHGDAYVEICEGGFG
ncbi:MAG: DUF4326 domain-containing protein [Candidatus Bathyarchaeota archaeon]|jgi:hypothetical protein